MTEKVLSSDISESIDYYNNDLTCDSFSNFIFDLDLAEIDCFFDVKVNEKETHVIPLKSNKNKTNNGDFFDGDKICSFDIERKFLGYISDITDKAMVASVWEQGTGKEYRIEFPVTDSYYGFDPNKQMGKRIVFAFGKKDSGYGFTKSSSLYFRTNEKTVPNLSEEKINHLLNLLEEDNDLS